MPNAAGTAVEVVSSTVAEAAVDHHVQPETAVPSVSIRAELCRRDGLCTRVCPVRIFNAEKGDVPSVRRLEECCLCGQCVACCPSGAIAHSGFGTERLRPIENRSPASPAAVEVFLAQRRSIRNYRKEPPPRDLIEKVLGAAAFAPGSPHHRVGWTRRFAVVVGEEAMSVVREATVEYVRRIHKLVSGWVVRAFSRFDDSARQAIGVAPDLAMRLAEWDHGRDAITYGAPAAIFAYAPTISSTPQTDCDAALLYAMLAAESHGLGTCWNGLLQGAAAGDHLRGFNTLRDFLGIPDGHKCYAATTIGYPAVEYRRVVERDVAVRWIGM